MLHLHHLGGRWAAIALGLALLLLLPACGAINLAGEPEIVATIVVPTPAPAAEAADVPVSAPDLRVGAAIFAENCTDCHGAGGAGDGQLVLAGDVPDPGNMTDWMTNSVDSPQQWYNTITNGVLEKLMPPWSGSLSEAERWSAAYYTYTLAYTPGQIEMGAAVVESLGDALDVAALTDLDNTAALTDAQLLAAVADAGDLPEEAAVAAVAYLRTASLNGLDAIGAEQPAVAMAGAADTNDGSSAGGAEGADMENPHGEGGSIPLDNAPNRVETISASVTGSVLNLTEGGGLPQDVPVTLYIFDDSLTMVDERETTLTEDGSFTFEDVEINPNYAYVSGVYYNERQFISEPIRGAAPLNDEGAFPLDIELYETTDDPSVIKIDRMAVQITGTEEGLQIAEVVIFRNDSDRMYTTAEIMDEEIGSLASTRLTLPPGAIVAGFGGASPQRFIVSDDGTQVIDTQPVLPDTEHRMQVIYLLPYEQRSGAIIEHPLNYDLDGEIRLLLAPETLDIQTDQLNELGELAMGDTVLREYASETTTLAAGQTISYELSGSPVARTTGGGGGNNLTLPIILFSVSMLAFAAAIISWWYGRRQGGGDDVSVDQMIDRLVQQIADLDSAHEAGTLNHDLWHKQRDELKAKLRLLMETKEAQA